MARAKLPTKMPKRRVVKKDQAAATEKAIYRASVAKRSEDLKRSIAEHNERAGRNLGYALSEQRKANASLHRKTAESFAESARRFRAQAEEQAEHAIKLEVELRRLALTL